MPLLSTSKQKVALKFTIQNLYINTDLPMRLNMGKFLDNGSCGLVLKPAVHRSLSAAPEAKKTLRIRVSTSLFLCLRINDEIGGQRMAVTQRVRNS